MRMKYVRLEWYSRNASGKISVLAPHSPSYGGKHVAYDHKGSR